MHKDCSICSGSSATQSVDGRKVTPASAASLDWSISLKNMMPLSATSFLMRLMVSGMEYALLMRTMPSSLAALAALDGNNIRANANSTTEQMFRMNINVLLWLSV
jgi:hypothetical protein